MLIISGSKFYFNKNNFKRVLWNESILKPALNIIWVSRISAWYIWWITNFTIFEFLCVFYLCFVYTKAYPSYCNTYLLLEIKQTWISRWSIVIGCSFTIFFLKQSVLLTNEFLSNNDNIFRPFITFHLKVKGLFTPIKHC